MRLKTPRVDDSLSHEIDPPVTNNVTIPCARAAAHAAYSSGAG